jgi:hypothetical protein
VALGGQVVDLGRLDRLERAREAVLVDEVAVVQRQPVADVVDPPGVERAAAADEAVDLVPFFQQQLRQVAAVLTGDAGDEGLRRQRASPEKTNYNGGATGLKGGERKKERDRVYLAARSRLEDPRPVARPAVPALPDVAPSKPRRSPRKVPTRRRFAARLAIPCSK